MDLSAVLLVRCKVSDVEVRNRISDVEIRKRINEPVDPKIVEDLSRKFGDFRRASTEGGIAIEELDSFGATRRTLQQIVAAWGDLDSLLRDFLLPNPETA